MEASKLKRNQVQKLWINFLNTRDCKFVLLINSLKMYVLHYESNFH